MALEIRDVDAALKNIVDSKNFTVHQENMEIRLRTIFSTPDEVLAKKLYPIIGIESGFIIDTPLEWQAESVEYTINGTDYQKADAIIDTVSDLFYDYKVAFYVGYKSHCVYLEREFLKLFPVNFVVFVTVGTAVYSVPFERKGIVNMDGFDEDRRFYRRDALLTAQIQMEDVTVETDYRPYTSVTVEVSTSTIY